MQLAQLFHRAMELLDARGHTPRQIVVVRFSDAVQARCSPLVAEVCGAVQPLEFFLTEVWFESTKSARLTSNDAKRSWQAEDRLCQIVTPPAILLAHRAHSVPDGDALRFGKRRYGILG